MKKIYDILDVLLIVFMSYAAYFWIQNPNIGLFFLWAFFAAIFGIKLWFEMEMKNELSKTSIS